MVDRELIIKCALHCDLQIRMEALEVICASKFSTDIPGPNQLEVLRVIIPYLIKLQTSNHRDQFVQLLQKLLFRMKNGCYKIMREMEKRMRKQYKTKLLSTLISKKPANCPYKFSTTTTFSTLKKEEIITEINLLRNIITRVHILVIIAIK